MIEMKIGRVDRSMRIVVEVSGVERYGTAPLQPNAVYVEIVNGGVIHVEVRGRRILKSGNPGAHLRQKVWRWGSGEPWILDAVRWAEATYLDPAFMTKPRG